MSDLEELRQLGFIANAKARWSTKPASFELRKAGEKIVRAAISAAASAYGDEPQACAWAARGDRARRGRLAAATGAFEALGQPDQQRDVAYAFDLEASAVARRRHCSPVFGAAADNARAAVAALLVEFSSRGPLAGECATLPEAAE